jgi:hypothetical protein
MLRSAISAALIGAAVGSVLAGGVLFARAQTPAAAAAAVGIDNFTFNPATVTVKGRHHGHLDQQGRHPAWARRDQQRLQAIAGARYRR